MSTLTPITSIASDDGAVNSVELRLPSAEDRLTNYRELPVHPKAPKMILPRVIQYGTTVLASYPGTGKTTAVTSLALIVAGAYKHASLSIMQPRHIVYLSEHPEQVEQILSALIAEGVVDDAVARERFHLVDTCRVQPTDLPPIARRWADDWTESLTRNGVTLDWAPWVVIDTAAATLHIENENDNAEWSAAISVWKQQCVGLPLLMVAHTSKAHKHGKAEDMTVRGASSIEGDVTQVIVLAKDETGDRYLEIAGPKHRFETDVSAIRLASHLADVNTVNEFGEPVVTPTRYVKLEPLTQDDRQERKRERQEAEANARKLQVAEKLRKIIPSLWESKQLPIQTALIDHCKSARLNFRKSEYATTFADLSSETLVHYDKHNLARLRPALVELGFKAPPKNCAGIYLLRDANPLAKIWEQLQSDIGDDLNVPNEPEHLERREGEVTSSKGHENGNSKSQMFPPIEK